MGRQEGERMKYEGVRDKWEEMIGRSGKKDEGEEGGEVGDEEEGVGEAEGTGAEGRLWGEGRQERRSGRRSEHDKRVRREGA